MCRGCQTAHNDADYISWMELMRWCWFWQVLRALPAETKVDGLPRASSNEVNIWLEELVSKSNIIQTQEDIVVSGKIAGQDLGKLCMKKWWISTDISRLVNSFGLAAFGAQEYIIVLQWIAAGPPGKSIWERLGGYKVRACMPRGRSGHLGPRWRAMLKI